MAKSSSKT